jgi:hypothetical protein
MPQRKKTTLYNRILKEFTKLNNKLPEDRKLSIQERRKIIKEKLLPKYKKEKIAPSRIRVKDLKGRIIRAVNKLPPKEICDLNYIDVSEYAYIEWFALDETISEIIPDCVYVKVSAGNYGETRIFNTRDYSYSRNGVRKIVEEIRPDAENASGKYIFSGYRKLRPKKRNDGTPENYYLDLILTLIDSKGNEMPQAEAESVTYELPKTRQVKSKKKKVKNVIEQKIRALKTKRDSRKRAKQTLAKNIDKLTKASKKLAKAKKPTKETQAALRKQFLASSKLLEKYYKEGKLTKYQYETSLAKILKEISS